MTIALAALQERIGHELGVSSWRAVPQGDIDCFAAVPGARQFVHVDPIRAARESPFGGTIAHGFLTLSLLSAFALEAVPWIEGCRVGVNYGFDRIRFIAPVVSGARIRGRFVLSDCTRRSASEVMVRYKVTVEIEGSERPALVADWITLAILEVGDGVPP